VRRRSAWRRRRPKHSASYEVPQLRSFDPGPHRRFCALVIVNVRALVWTERLDPRANIDVVTDR
jgi:hypothetical protein